jgi:hypothetical protein
MHLLPVGMEREVEGHLCAQGADVELVAMDREAEPPAKERSAAARQVLNNRVA